jgi:hypothetical protein
MLVFSISKPGVCLHYETQLTHTKGCTSSKNTLHTPLNLRIAASTIVSPYSKK